MESGQKVKIISGKYKGKMVTLTKSGSSGWFVKEEDVGFVFKDEIKPKDSKLCD